MEFAEADMVRYGLQVKFTCIVYIDIVRQFVKFFNVLLSDYLKILSTT